MTNKVDFSEWNPDRLETDDEDLMRTIYAYFCNGGYPHRLQEAIDTTIQILDSGDNTYLEIEALIMELAGAADLWGGFNKDSGQQLNCYPVTHSEKFLTRRNLMENEERNETINELYGSVQDTHNYGKTYYYQQAKEIAAVTAIAMIRDGVPPVDIRICIDNWYGVEIPEHAMKILEAEAKSDEEEEQLTGKRRTDLSPSSLRDRCCRIRKAKRMCECGVSPDIIHSVYPELSEEEIDNICSSVDSDNTGTEVDNLTLRQLQEVVATPLKTTVERVAYLRGRWDKAKEVVQDLYCNHGGNSHPVYDFFQDSDIKYEDIIGWKMEAQQHLEQKAIEKRAKEIALRLLRAGMDPAATKASIKEWFCVDLSDSAFEYLVGQVEIEKNFSKIADAIEGRPGNVNPKNE